MLRYRQWHHLPARRHLFIEIESGRRLAGDADGVLYSARLYLLTV